MPERRLGLGLIVRRTLLTLRVVVEGGRVVAPGRRVGVHLREFGDIHHEGFHAVARVVAEGCPIGPGVEMVVARRVADHDRVVAGAAGELHQRHLFVGKRVFHAVDRQIAGIAGVELERIVKLRAVDGHRRAFVVDQVGDPRVELGIGAVELHVVALAGLYFPVYPLVAADQGGRGQRHGGALLGILGVESNPRALVGRRGDGLQSQ